MVSIIGNILIIINTMDQNISIVLHRINRESATHVNSMYVLVTVVY